jgi:hypothetical protein
MTACNISSWIGNRKRNPPVCLLFWTTLLWTSSLQGTAAQTQADDAAVLLQVKAAYNLTALNWSGSQPCAAGIVSMLSAAASAPVQACTQAARAVTAC